MLEKIAEVYLAHKPVLCYGAVVRDGVEYFEEEYISCTCSVILSNEPYPSHDLKELVLAEHVAKKIMEAIGAL